MLKTHAERLRKSLNAKELYWHPSLQVEVIVGKEKKDFRVRVQAEESLISDIMGENASSEYLDNKEQTRRRIDATTMEFF